MTDDPTDSAQPTPLFKRVLGWAAGIAAVALLAFAAVHVMIPPVSPDQETPPGHFGEPCIGCHIISGGTDVIDVGN